MSVRFDSPEMRRVRQKVGEVILNVDALSDAESVVAAMMLLSPLVDGLDAAANPWAWAAGAVAAAALLADNIAAQLDLPIPEVLHAVLDLDAGMS
jgi:hypothetical protein